LTVGAPDADGPAVLTAVTWKVPAVAPAVYTPAAVIVPPVALHVTFGFACVLPLLNVAVAVNCRACPLCRLTVAGDTAKAVTVGGGAAATVTALEADGPAVLTAVTWKLPAVAPAV
jgi:hypothetical protein